MEVSSATSEVALTNLFYSFLDRFGAQFINLTFTFVLARMLSPEDFGLVGVLSIVIAISSSIIDSGLGNALIRKPAPTIADYSTVFWINICMGSALGAALLLFSRQISDFYKAPNLIVVCRYYSLSVFLNSLLVIPINMLVKNINFKFQFKINILSSLLAGLLGCFCAYKGWGFKSLLVQIVTRDIVNVVCYYYYLKWRPVLVFDKASFKELFGFGSKLLVGSLVDTIGNNIQNSVIGKYYSIRAAGFYDRAYKLQQLLVATLTVIFQRVTYPLFAKVENESEEKNLLRPFRFGLQLISLVIFPLLIGLASISSTVILFIYGKQWAASIPLFQVLCFAGAFFPLSAYILNLSLVKNKPSVFLKLDIIKQVIWISILLLVYKRGVLNIALAAVFFNIFALALNSFFCLRLIEYEFKHTLVDIVKPLLFSVLNFFIIEVCKQVLDLNFIVYISFFFLLYLLESYLFNKAVLLNFWSVCKLFINKAYVKFG